MDYIYMNIINQESLGFSSTTILIALGSVNFK